MNKVSRFNGFGIEDEDTVTTGDGETAVTVNAEPPKDNAEEAPTDTPVVSENEEGNETPTEEPSEEIEDLEIKEDDSEEVVEEKEKKIKIEIEIAQEEISQMTTAIASLEGICKQMEDSLQRGGLNVQGRSIAKTSVQHIANQFKLDPQPVSSLESYGYQIDDFHATRISIEGISETIKTIIEKIKIFFISIGEKIKKIINFFKIKHEKQKKDIEEIKKNEVSLSKSEKGVLNIAELGFHCSEDKFFRELNNFTGTVHAQVELFESIEKYLKDTLIPNIGKINHGKSLTDIKLEIRKDFLNKFSVLYHRIFNIDSSSSDDVVTAYIMHPDIVSGHRPSIELQQRIDVPSYNFFITTPGLKSDDDLLEILNHNGNDTRMKLFTIADNVNVSIGKLIILNGSISKLADDLHHSFTANSFSDNNVPATDEELESFISITNDVPKFINQSVSLCSSILKTDQRLLDKLVKLLEKSW